MDENDRLQDLIYAISDIQKLVSRLMVQETLKENLTLQQSAVLRILLNAGPMQMNHLGRELLTTAANITSLVDRMEKKRLVQRDVDKTDRRKVVVRLTPAGRQLFETAARRYRDNVRASVEILTDQEREQLRRLLVKLRDEIARRETQEADVGDDSEHA